MRTSHLLTTGLLLCGLAAPVSARRVAPLDTEPMKLAVQSNNQFAFDLYRELAGEAKESNLFFSPVSINAALSLTYEGARGSTKTAFETTLRLPDDIDRAEFHKSLSAVLGALDGKDKPYQLGVANSLWGERTMPFRNAFLKTLDTHYDAGFVPVDFRGAPDDQRKRINGWVEEKTNDRIKDLIPKGVITRDTRLVLANAIYFKAEWREQFKKHMTQDKPFYGIGKDNKRDVKTQTMHLNGERFLYADLDELDILELPYKGNDLSMLILLPGERDGLADLEKKLSAETLAKWVGELKGGDVNVQMPKWEATYAPKVVPALKRMGLAVAFEAGKADFTGISDSAEGQGLFISDIVHKAFVKVDENGSEAAAATAVVVDTLSARIDPPKPFEFKADHPFVYLIRDTRTGAVLFVGRMTNPS